MQVLREISSQTADSTSNTSEAVAKLALLSASLRKSVAGFRLPEAAPGGGTQRIAGLPAGAQHFDPASSVNLRRAAGGVPNG
jgi:hypothetical protein